MVNYEVRGPFPALDDKIGRQIVDARGDMIVGVGADAVARVPAGDDGYVLVADSTQPAGVRWSDRPVVPISSGGDWDDQIYGDIVSNGPRHAATSPWAFSSTSRTLLLLLGWLPADTVIGGFRLYRTTAMTGGVASAGLYTASSLGAASWNRVGAAVAPSLTSTGMLTQTYTFTQLSAGFVALQLVLTTAPSAYPALAATAAGQAALLGPAAAGAAAVVGASSDITAAGTTLDPTTGWTHQTQKPWCALF